MESTRSDLTGPKPTDVAWLAGIVDGEGYVCYRKTPTVQVETVTPELAYIPASIFGGSVTTQQRRNASVFRWSVYGDNAIKVLKHLIPYLQYKKAQAEIVLNSGRYPPKSAMRKSHHDRLNQLRKKRYNGAT